MKINYHLISKENNQLWIKIPGAGKARRVCTVDEVSQILGKSQRHIYRYLTNGTLTSFGKILGEWVIDYLPVESLAQTPLTRQPPPSFLAPLFPEYDLKKLNVSRDRVVVLSRVLEQGGVREVRWVMKRYSIAEICGFLLKDGARLLSDRALGFWVLFYQLTKPKKPEWRKAPW